MSTETVAGPQGEWRSATTAAGGTALTATALRIPIPRGTKQIVLIPRNYSTAVVVQYNLNPFLTILKTTDSLLTQGGITDYSDAAQDLSTSTKVTLNSLDTAANGNYLYVASYLPFSGVEVDISAANSNASVLTVKYWNGTTWTDISASDGTASGGATFAVDGNVTWTVPASWSTAPLKKSATSSGTGDTALNIGRATAEFFFWTRWEVSAALDSTTDCNAMLAINRDATYAELPSGLTMTQAVNVGEGGIFSLTAKTDAGTANLILNCSTRNGGRF